MISTELLAALLSFDGDRRSQAETCFRSMSTTDRINGLLHRLVLANSNGNEPQQPEVELLTAVLLRRETLKLTESNMLEELVGPLLQCFTSSAVNNRNTSPAFRLQVSHCLAEVCATLSLVGDASSVLPAILSAVEPMVSRMDVPSLKLLANLADRAPIAFTAQAVQHLPTIVGESSVLQKIVQQRPEVLAALTEVLVNGSIASTVKASDATLVGVAPPPPLDEIVVDEAGAAASLGPALCQVLSLLATSSCEQTIQASLQHMGQAAVASPSLLAGSRPVLEAVVGTCLQFAASESWTSDLRLSALQVLASLISVGDVKRRILVTYSDVAAMLIGQTIPLCAHLAVTGVDDDCEDWAADSATLLDENGSGWDNDQQACHAESLLEEFLLHLGSAALAVVLPIVQELLTTDAANIENDWKRPRAGLALIEAALMSTPKSLSPHVPVVLNAALSFAASTNARVQWQAVRLLGALCESDKVDIRASHGALTLERLAGAAASPCSKVSTMASLALVSYCRGGIKHERGGDASTSVVPYLRDVLGALVRGPLSLPGMDTGSITVKVRAMGAVACLAEAAGDEFEAWYASVMPGLLASAQLPSVELAGAAIQAATIVGASVGAEMFQNDANQLLAWIVPALQTTTTTIPLDQLLSACARIAGVLGEDFAPHVASVLPYLLRMAQQAPDVSVVEGNEADTTKRQAIEIDEDGTESMTVAIPGRGWTKVTINTTKIQEKAQAARAIYELASALAAQFGPYVEACFEALLPLVSFQYSADVRSTAAQTLSAIFDCSCAHGEHVGMQLPQKYFPLLARAIAQRIYEEDTSDIEALHALADSLSEINYIIYRYRAEQLGSDIVRDFKLENANHLVKCCMEAMKSCLKRRESTAIILRGSVTGEDEREEYVELLRLEESLLTPLVDSVGYTLKFLRNDFVPIFEKEIAPVLGPYLTSGKDVRASVAAVCLFDDCVEHCGPEAAAKYSPHLVQGVCLALGADPSNFEKDLVQASVYGIAQMARFAPRHVMESQIQNIVHQLLSMTNCSKEEAGDNVGLVEYAVSALASLTLFGPFKDLKFLNQDTLINTFLSHLPLQEDEDEAKICHAGLCELIDNGTINVVSEAAQLTSIMGEILSRVAEGDDLATPDTCSRFGAILNQVQHEVAPASIERAFASLSPEGQAAIRLAIQESNRSPVVTP